MALTPFDMEGVNRDLLAAGNPAKPDMQSILRRNALICLPTTRSGSGSRTC